MHLQELKSLLLNKGWAGKTMSRHDTTVRLNGLLSRHLALIGYYDRADALAWSPETLEAVRRRVRLDAGKLAETIFSCGGVATSKGNAERTPPSGRALLARLMQNEQQYNVALRKERTAPHHMRTQAVLQHCLQSSQERLNFLATCRQRARTGG